MDYPSDEEIRRRLRPYQIGLWLAAFFVLPAGLAVEIWESLPDSFVRSGGVLLIATIYVYFHLENREFLTGRAGNLIDSDNHHVPKKVLGTTYFWVSLAGSIVSIFGDLLIALFQCGRLECML